MDATHPFETQDLQLADLVEREGRALVFVLAKWDLVEDPQARASRAPAKRPSACCRNCAARRWSRSRPRPGAGWTG